MALITPHELQIPPYCLLGTTTQTVTMPRSWLLPGTGLARSRRSERVGARPRRDRRYPELIQTEWRRPHLIRRPGNQGQPMTLTSISSILTSSGKGMTSPMLAIFRPHPRTRRSSSSLQVLTEQDSWHRHFYEGPDGILRRRHPAQRDLVQILLPKFLQPRVLRLCHYSLLAGQPGLNRMYYHIRRIY